MNLFAITSLLVTICSLLLSIFVFYIGKTKLHKTWGMFNFTVSLWAAGTFLAAIATTPHHAELAWRLAYGLGSIVPFMFYYFNHTFCDLENKKLLKIFFIISILFIPLNIFSPFFITRMNFLFDSFYYNEATPLYSIFLLYLTSGVLMTFKELLFFYKKSSGFKKSQALYLLCGFFIGWSGGYITFLPAYNINIYPAWNLVVCFYIILMTYAIFRFNLLNFVIRKSLVYSIAATLVTVLFLILVVSFERLFQNILGYKSILGSIIAALVIATVFTPLRNKIQKIFDRIFYQGTPEEISQQNELLRQEVAQAEKFKAVATLASGMAHEIKNPLTAIKTFSEYLRIKGEDPEFREKFSELVGKEVDRVDNLVHELLEFARPAPLTLKDTNIHKLLDETLEFLSSKLVKHNINTEKAFKSDIELIKADPNQLKQVFLNLFMNAIDAMEKGGTLTISTLNPNPSTLSISIKDTGCGIPKEDLKHIFDPFFTKKDNGTGLGLAISYGIIKEHHGDIKVKSKPNEGTEFIVELKLDS